MKKALLALAVMSAASLANAQSSVTLYGLVGATVAFSTNQPTSTGGSGNKLSLQNNDWGTSFWGMKGTEDLGGGMKAFFTLESGFSSVNGNVATFNGSSPLFGRSAYVGIGGKWGRVSMGRQFSAMVDELVENVDPINIRGTAVNTPGAVLLAAAASSVPNAGDSRMNNSIKYRNEFGGLHVDLSYAPGGVAGSNTANTGFAGGLGYNFGPVAISGGYQDFRDPTAQLHNKIAVGGVKVTLGNAVLYASYLNDAIDRAGGVTEKHSMPFVGAKYTLNNIIFTGAFYHDTSKNLAGVNGLNGTKNTGVFVADYFLSKRTSVYASYVYNGFSNGYLNARGGALNKAALPWDGTSSNTQSFMLGMKHAF